MSDFSTTLEDFFNLTYLAIKPDADSVTIGHYRRTIKRFGEFIGQVATLENLNDQQVGQYLAHRRQVGNAATTINKERTNLLCLWRLANARGQVVIGPLVKRLNEPEKVPTALTVEQLRRLRATFDKLRGHTGGLRNRDIIRACFAIQFATAERVGAVVQLRWADISGDVVTFRSTTRKGSRRALVRQLPAWAMRDLEPIRQPERDEVFPGCHNSGKIWLLYDRLFKRAGVPRPKWKSSHLLRSTRATLIHAAGGDATESLGHQSSDTTRKSYLDPRHDPTNFFEMLPDIDSLDETNPQTAPSVVPAVVDDSIAEKVFQSVESKSTQKKTASIPFEVIPAKAVPVTVEPIAEVVVQPDEPEPIPQVIASIPAEVIPATLEPIPATITASPKRMSKRRWLAKIKRAATAKATGHQFVVVDLMTYGFLWLGMTWREIYVAVSEHTGLPKKTLINWKGVVTRFPPELRRDGLKFTHYSLLRALPEVERIEWIDRIEIEGIKSQRLRELLADSDSLNT